MTVLARGLASFVFNLLGEPVRDLLRPETIMAVILHFPARPIRRPIAVVAITQRRANTSLWRRLLDWWFGPALPPDLPDFLREDMGIEPRLNLYDRRITGYHPVDVTMLHGWKR